MNYYYLAKSLHIIGFVSWFAGLLYLVRLFIYHAEATEKKTVEEQNILLPQYELMSTRLYTIITNPAMILTWIGGISMIILGYTDDAVPNWMKINNFATDGWLHIKLSLVLLLTGYHHYMKSVLRKLKNGTNKYSSEQLRGLNEVPTVFLAAIVLLAVFKNMLNFGYAFAGLVVFGFALAMGVKIYKKIREKS